jgi:hypothetical protein
MDAVLNEASSLSEQRQQRMDAAAALRAAADQVDWESGDPKFLVLAIAAELEGQ